MPCSVHRTDMVPMEKALHSLREQGSRTGLAPQGTLPFELASFASPVVISSSWFAEISAHVFNRPYRNFIPAPSKGIQPP